MRRASDADAARGAHAAAEAADGEDSTRPAYGTLLDPSGPFPEGKTSHKPAPDPPLAPGSSPQDSSTASEARGGHSEEQDEAADEGDALPFLHPDSTRTSRWRKLMFELFSRQSLKAQIEAGEIWRLPKALTSAQASATFAEVYTPGNCFSLKWAVVRVHWRELAVCWLLQLGSLAFSSATPIILYAVLQTAVSGEYTLLPLAVRLVLLYLSTLAEIVMVCHSRFLGFKINVRITGALRTLLFETTLGNAPRVVQSYGGIASFLCSESDEDTPAPRSDSNHQSDDMKKRMAEVAHMYSHDVVAAAETVTHMAVMWRTALQIMIQLYILVQVVGISAKPIFIALGVIAIVLRLTSQFVGRMAKKLMRAAEERLNALHECFKSIQMIKLNAWEDKMIHKIEHARSKETELRRGMSAFRALQSCFVHDSPNLASIMIFAWMAMQQEEFSPAQVFPALLLFRRIKDDFNSIVALFDLSTAGHTSFWKLSTYFNENRRSAESVGATDGGKKKEDRSYSQQVKPYTVISMDQACFAPSADASKPLLLNVTLSIPKGSLVVVQGKAGAGKSTLLNAILGNVESVYGDVFVRDTSKVAYCAQEAWLQTLSIRENILFGSPLDEHKYRCVLEACCLVEDLRSLPEGDATMVGSKGINLSGGQKSRIALARACYADADLYLLDCPFASVDPIVQNDIFAKCIVGLLRYKTVVLVTHNPELSSSEFVDQLVKVENMTTQVQPRVAGRQNGSNKRSSRRADAANSLPPWKRPAAPTPAKGSESALPPRPDGLFLWEPSVVLSSVTVATPKPPSEVKNARSTSAKAPAASLPASAWCEMQRVSSPKFDFQFFTRDKMRTFFNSSTMRYMVPGKIFLVLYAIAVTAKDIWLMSWSASSTPTKPDMLRSINIYASLVVSSVVFGILSTILHTKALSLTANDLFHSMTAALLRAPMSFFYRTPVGEIFSRYFHDMRIADTEFVVSFLAVFRSSVTIVASDIMVWYYTGIAGTGVLLIFFIAIRQFVSLGYAAALLQRAFQTEADNLNLISEALDGSTTIRAFGRSQIARFCFLHGVISDELLRGRYHAEAFQCFVLVRCDRVLGLHIGIILALLSTHKIAPAELGLLLYYVFTINSDVFTLTSQMLQSIRYRFNIERIVEYTSITPEEAPLTPQQEQLEQKLPTPVKAVDPTAAWPTKGDVVFENVGFAYSAQVKSGARDVQGALALRDVSFSVRGGEKIGVVGRTGSGKSSLAMALFRVHALQRGRILIDGVDVSTMRLDKLRRNVCILPQTPLFYRCSVRAYLDPFDEREDEELWRVLTQCGLESSVRTLEGEMLTDNGENWSVGERQMLCLARAALSPSRVVILDESFSAVDQAGQSQLLSVLDSVFAHSTIFLITHRLEEILEFDRILVMRDGRAVEFGAADELATNPDSAFYEFLETTLLTF